jgi:hypothetical protein
LRFKPSCGLHINPGMWWRKQYWQQQLWQLVQSIFQPRHFWRVGVPRGFECGSTTLIEADVSANGSQSSASGPSQIQTATYSGGTWYVNGACPSPSPGQNSMSATASGDSISLTFNEGGNTFTGQGRSMAHRSPEPIQARMPTALVQGPSNSRRRHPTLHHPVIGEAGRTRLGYSRCRQQHKPQMWVLVRSPLVQDSSGDAPLSPFAAKKPKRFLQAFREPWPSGRRRRFANSTCPFCAYCVTVNNLLVDTQVLPGAQMVALANAAFG